MKIVKTFLYEQRPYREWGLGDDGNLYSRFIGSGAHRLEYPEGWVEYDSESSFGVPFDEMRRLVKEFGNLVIFT